MLRVYGLGFLQKFYQRFWVYGLGFLQRFYQRFRVCGVSVLGLGFMSRISSSE